MKKLTLYSFLFISLLGCNRNDNGILEQKISSYINEECQNQYCEIDLSKITTFKWTRFYFFKETSSNQEIEKVINQKYPYFNDVARHLIFLNNDKIVYHEDIFPNVEGITKNDIIFLVPDSLNYKEFVNSKFKVTKDTVQNGNYFILNQ